MTRPRTGSILLSFAAALAVAGCNRGTPPPGVDATQPAASAVLPGTASVSTPMPVSPTGSTNATIAAQGSDLSNSTRAGGTSNVYQPSSGDNPAPGASAGGSPAVAGAASSAGQTTSSETRGTSMPPNSGTLPGGTTGSTGSQRGGGKS